MKLVLDKASQEDAKLFAECFRTHAGKKVLSKLRDTYYDYPPRVMSDAESHFYAGCRSVVFDILDLIKLYDEENI